MARQNGGRIPGRALAVDNVVAQVANWLYRAGLVNRAPAIALGPRRSVSQPERAAVRESKNERTTDQLRKSRRFDAEAEFYLDTKRSLDLSVAKFLRRGTSRESLVGRQQRPRPLSDLLSAIGGHLPPGCRGRPRLLAASRSRKQRLRHDGAVVLGSAEAHSEHAKMVTAGCYGRLILQKQSSSILPSAKKCSLSTMWLCPPAKDR